VRYIFQAAALALSFYMDSKLLFSRLRLYDLTWGYVTIISHRRSKVGQYMCYHVNTETMRVDWISINHLLEIICLNINACGWDFTEFAWAVHVFRMWKITLEIRQQMSHSWEYRLLFFFLFCFSFLVGHLYPIYSDAYKVARTKFSQTWSFDTMD